MQEIASNTYWQYIQQFWPVLGAAANFAFPFISKLRQGALHLTHESAKISNVVAGISCAGVMLGLVIEKNHIHNHLEFMPHWTVVIGAGIVMVLAHFGFVTKMKQKSKQGLPMAQVAECAMYTISFTLLALGFNKPVVENLFYCSIEGTVAKEYDLSELSLKSPSGGVFATSQINSKRKYRFLLTLEEMRQAVLVIASEERPISADAGKCHVTEDIQSSVPPLATQKVNGTVKYCPGDGGCKAPPDSTVRVTFDRGQGKVEGPADVLSQTAGRWEASFDLFETAAQQLTIDAEWVPDGRYRTAEHQTYRIPATHPRTVDLILMPAAFAGLSGKQRYDAASDSARAFADKFGCLALDGSRGLGAIQDCWGRRPNELKEARNEALGILARYDAAFAKTGNPRHLMDKANLQTALAQFCDAAETYARVPPGDRRKSIAGQYRLDALTACAEASGDQTAAKTVVEEAEALQSAETLSPVRQRVVQANLARTAQLISR